jgi:hypothetical protein
MMKKILLFILYLSGFAVYSQQVKWAKQYPKGIIVSEPRQIISFPNGIVVSGWEDSYPSSYLSIAFICAIDSTGNKLWSDSLFTDPHHTASQAGLALSTDNSIYMGGNFDDTLITQTGNFISNCSSGNIFLTKYDLNGQLKWVKTFGNQSRAELRDLEPDASNNIIMLIGINDSITLTGQVYNSLGEKDLLVVKIDSAGQVIWTKQISGNIASDKIKVLNSGSIMIFGKFIDTLFYDAINYSGPSSMAEPQFFFTKLSPTGAATGCTFFPYAAEPEVEVLNDKLIITGLYTWHAVGTTVQLWDTLGNFSWSKTIPNHSLGYEDHCLNNITALDSTGFWLFGQELDYGVMINANDDVRKISLLKYDFNSNIIVNDSFQIAMPQGSRYVPFSGITHDQFNNIYCTSTFIDTVVFGSYALASAEQTLFVTKFNLDNLLTSIESNIPKDNEKNIFPNPSSGIFTLSISKSHETKICVYDPLGNCLLKNNYLNETNLMIDISNQPKGIYFIEIISDEKRIVKKVVMQ